MTDDLEVRLEIGMAEAVDAAQREKDAWKEQHDFVAQWVFNGAGGVFELKCADLKTKAHERYLYWQREEEMRRKALRHWRKEDE